RGAGLEDCGHPGFLETVDVLIGDNAAHEDDDVVHLVLLEQVHHARNDRVVRAGEDRKSNYLNVFLQRGGHNHFGSLADACVDDLHASIAQCTGDNFGASVVPVEAGFGYQHTNLCVHHQTPFNHSWDNG